MKVKICGITHPEDAEYAACLGADYIGMIFWHRSKRYVSPSQAKEISRAAILRHAIPVGIFVDETLDQILLWCEQAEIQMIQLHGKESQKHLTILQNRYPIIYAISVGIDGSVSQDVQLPSNGYPLFDCLGGGTGKSFDWQVFSPPKDVPWMLAGGLNANNVAAAIRLLKPQGVDVATGVEIPQTTRKDPLLVKMFIETAKQLEEK